MANTYEMKDSGVEWIGQIPRTWKVGRIKYNYYLKGRIGWQGLKADEFIDHGPYYLITGTDFDNGRIAWERCYRITEERFFEAPEIHVKTGDLLITKDGTVGKVAYIDSIPEKASLNSHLLIMRPLHKEYDNRFLFWVIQSAVFEKYCGVSQNGSIMASLSQEKMSDFSFPLPPEQEIEKLVSYLRKKCGAIDDIVAEAKATIEEYKKWKASVIFEAVTKGLDPNAEMKDSGVEWIGQIPKGWGVRRLKMAARRLGLPAENLHGYIGLENVKSGSGKLVEAAEGETTPEGQALKIYPGNVIFGKLRPYLAKCYLVEREGCCSSEFLVIKAEIMTPKFLKFLMLSPGFINEVNMATYGTKMPRANWEIVGGMRMPIPSASEQTAIASYLDDKCAAIDGIIAEKEALITELENYKKSLIFETVTGKRRVC